MASAPLVPNEAPPAYSGPPPAGFKQDGQGYGPGYQQGVPPGYQQGGPAGYAGPPGYMGGQQQPSYMAGQAPPPQPGGQGVIVVQASQAPVVVVGGCPACRVGVLEDDFSVLGVCCAILFFPIGILCCLAMRQRHCPNCGAVFG